MKKLTMLLSLFAATAMISCSTDDLDGMSGGSGANGSDETATLVVKVQSQDVTRAEGDEVAGLDNAAVVGGGTANENAVKNLSIVGFDKEYDFINVYDAATATSGSTFSFKVAPNVKYLFVVVNGANDALKEMKEKLTANADNWSHNTHIPFAFNAAELLGTNLSEFLMVSAGSFEGDLDNRFTDVGVLKTGVDVTGAPNVNKVTVKVDRVVSKFSYAVNSSLGTPTNVQASIDGVALTATNKNMYLYSPIMTETDTQKRDYRMDPNMSIEYLDGSDETKKLDQLNWLSLEGGYDAVKTSFATTSESQYVLENTAEPSFYNSNNLTQAIVKATYLPDPANICNEVTATGEPTHSTETFTLGNTWYQITVESQKKTYAMSFAGVKAFYGYLTKDATITANMLIAKRMDYQLNHILGNVSGETAAAAYTPSTTWANVDEATLAAVTNSGYLGATVKKFTDDTDKDANYVVQYYPAGACYYDVFIQHDDAMPIGNLGRWGMVRNNWYTLTVNSVKEVGLPYIPDPTDPEIVDPTNPDPENPDPADLGEADLDVTIAVNSWTIWSQGADLGQDQSGDYGAK